MLSIFNSMKIKQGINKINYLFSVLFSLLGFFGLALLFRLHFLAIEITSLTRVNIVLIFSKMLNLFKKVHYLAFLNKIIDGILLKILR